MARVIRGAGCGVVANRDDPALVVTAVKELASNPARLAVMGQRAREIAPEFAMQEELQLFTHVLEETGRRDRSKRNVD